MRLNYLRIYYSWVPSLGPKLGLIACALRLASGFWHLFESTVLPPPTLAPLIYSQVDSNGFRGGLLVHVQPWLDNGPSGELILGGQTLN